MAFSDRIAKRFAHRRIGLHDNIGGFDEEVGYVKKMLYEDGNFFGTFFGTKDQIPRIFFSSY